MYYGETLNQVVRMARKRHTCDWCHEAIEPKTKYNFWVGIIDHEFNKTKMHPECDEVWNDYVTETLDCLLPYQAQPRGKIDWELL